MGNQGSNHTPSIKMDGLPPLDDQVEQCWEELAQMVAADDLEMLLTLSGLAGTMQTFSGTKAPRNRDHCTHHYVPAAKSSGNLALLGNPKPNEPIENLEVLLNPPLPGLPPNVIVGK